MKSRNLHHFSAIALFLMSFSQFSLAQNGCIDPLACNFDPNAVVDDGTCSYTIDCAGICGGENVLDFCGNCYNPNGPSEPVLFAYTGNLQQWIIPDGVTTVTIEAWGAQGGNAPGNVRTGGLGAYMKGDFAVIPGQVLNIVVGGQGLTKPNDGGTNYGGGGGGGSFIWISPNTPLLIAGGGGGAHNSANGGSGLTGSSGGNSNNGAAGGSNGNGGGGGGTCAGAGGGGWISAGTNASCFNYATLFGGGSFDSFLAGLCGAPCNAGGANYGTSGGYGGGAAGWHGGGGGGGYSGGGGGGNSVGNGGGGGSYNAGDNQAATAGVNSGNGSVLISFSGIPECLAGCTDPLACNYDPSAELEDGSCAYPDGCADPSACNYDPAAQCDNGTCTYPGCNDPAACNFDAQAGCDNGSCAYVLDCAGVCDGNFVEDACGNCYDPNAANDNLTFAYTGNLQQWTVPDGVTSLTIEARGAQGGNAPGNVRTGGLGAYIKGDFTVVPGQVLNIVVGGQGLTKPNDGGTTYGGGGGGGSFIWISPNTPLLIAGGGGGALDSANGGSGLTGSSGGNSNNGAAGGSNGNGGGGGGTCAGAGGGGWVSAGTNASCFNYATLFGGGSFDSFLAGLCGAPCNAGGANYGTSGGYGGGAAGWHGGGGGGGYSGGGGGGNSVGNGGGGGSYNAGINQVSEAGINSGNGVVIISFAGLPDCIPGCTDPLADNYNPEANFDDGSCVIQGCTNPLALNYNPLATNDDGSCFVPGCTYADAINFNPNANTDDGSCQFDSCPQVSGCTDHLACNFTPGANADDGSCDYTCYGCTYADSPNYDPSATIDDGSCDFSCNEDLNGDGLINTSDLLNLLAVFGNACE